jgi:hypothetical protein
MQRLAAFSFIALGVFVGCAVGSDEPANPGDPIAQAARSTDASLSPDAVSPQEGIDAAVPEPATDASVKAVQDAGPPDVISDAATEASASCTGYASPSTSAACNACGSGSQTCDPNGCFNGYYCRLSDAKCMKKPAACP